MGDLLSFSINKTCPDRGYKKCFSKKKFLDLSSCNSNIRYYVALSFDIRSKTVPFPDFWSICVVPILAQQHLLDLEHLAWDEKCFASLIKEKHFFMKIITFLKTKWSFQLPTNQLSMAPSISAEQLAPPSSTMSADSILSSPTCFWTDMGELYEFNIKNICSCFAC